MTDPGMGYWEYKYNALGELTSQMDAKAQTVTMDYDLLGRLVKRTEAEGISQWTYDTAPMGKGKLAQLTGPGGCKQTTGYDALGRIGAIAYPAVNGNRFTVHHSYTAQGHLAEVKNAATGQSYWKANALDAAGRPTAEILGNGLSTVRTWHPASGALQAINTGATNRGTSSSRTPASGSNSATAPTASAPVKPSAAPASPRSPTRPPSTSIRAGTAAPTTKRPAIRVKRRRVTS